MKATKMGVLCLFLVLAFAVCLTPAFAEGDNLQTVLKYTKAPEPEPVLPPTVPDDPGDDPTLPTYKIVLPAEETINNGSAFPISLSENNIPAGYVLSVNIDSGRSYGEDGLLHLKGENSGNDATVIINRYSHDGSYTAVTQLNNPPVALFTPGDIRPVEYGTLSWGIVDEDRLEADTYTGSIYFDIVLIPEEFADIPL